MTLLYMRWMGVAVVIILLFSTPCSSQASVLRSKRGQAPSTGSSDSISDTTHSNTDTYPTSPLRSNTLEVTNHLSKLNPHNSTPTQYEESLRPLIPSIRTSSSTLHFHKSVIKQLEQQGANKQFIEKVLDLSRATLTRMNRNKSFKTRRAKGWKVPYRPPSVIGKQERDEVKAADADSFAQLLQINHIKPASSASKLELQTRKMIEGHESNAKLTRQMYRYMEVERHYNADDIKTAKAQRTIHNYKQRRRRYLEGKVDGSQGKRPEKRKARRNYMTIQTEEEEEEEEEREEESHHPPHLFSPVNVPKRKRSGGRGRRGSSKPSVSGPQAASTPTMTRDEVYHLDQSDWWNKPGVFDGD